MSRLESLPLLPGRKAPAGLPQNLLIPCTLAVLALLSAPGCAQGPATDPGAGKPGMSGHALTTEACSDTASNGAALSEVSQVTIVVTGRPDGRQSSAYRACQ